MRNQRPLLETLPRIRIDRDLVIPHDYKVYSMPFINLKFPVSGLKLSWNCAEFYHNGRSQRFRIKHVQMPHGHKRHYFICDCGRPVCDLYYHRSNIACRHKLDAIYSSQGVSQRGRPILQATRLRRILNDSKYLHKTTIAKLKRRLASLHVSPTDKLPKRVSDYKVQLPLHNYGLQ